MPSFYNTPMQPTKPTVAAPPINEYREALYDEALPDDPGPARSPGRPRVAQRV